MKMSPFQIKILALLGSFAMLAAGVKYAAADNEGGGDFAGTFVASLPERAEIMHIHRDGTASMTLSDQVTFGAGGFTFSDSLGSWKITGPRHLTARFANLNFDLTGAAPAFSGIAIVDYEIQFATNKKTFTTGCVGKIYATGDDPLDPNAVPVAEFDCAYLNGYQYKRVSVP